MKKQTITLIRGEDDCKTVQFTDGQVENSIYSFLNDFWSFDLIKNEGKDRLIWKDQKDTDIDMNEVISQLRLREDIQITNHSYSKELTCMPDKKRTHIPKSIRDSFSLIIEFMTNRKDVIEFSEPMIVSQISGLTRDHNQMRSPMYFNSWDSLDK